MAATDTEQLVVQLEARVSQFEKSFQRANRTASRNWREIENRGRQASSRIQLDMSRAANGVANSFRRMGAAMIASLGAAVSVRAISAAAQQYVNLQNALKVTGLEGEALQKTFADLYKVAQANGTPIEALVTLYSRATQSQKSLKASSADLMKFTNGVSVALRVSGTSAQEASGALLQLSQALGGGVIQAEEYNSLIDGARPILQAVAAGLKEAGGSVATLTSLVKSGKVSSEAFFRAFLAGMPMLQEQAAKAQGTISQAMNRVGNAFTLLIGELDKTSGASARATENLNGVAKAIEQMPSYIKAAADGLSSLESWLAKVGNNPIWDRINKFLGIDGAAKAREFSEAVNKPVASTTTTATAPAAKPEIKPVSLADFTLPGKKTGKSAADTRHSQVESYIQQLEKSGRVLQAEYDTLGKSNSERAKAIELARIGTVTDAGQVKRIEAAVDANEQLRQKIEQVTRAQEGLRDAAQYAGEAITDSLADVLIDGKDASDVIDNLARQLARAALQSALIGSGPLSGLFGTRNASGGLGGLFGALLGGFAFADGGIMTARGPLPLKRYDRGGIANSPQLALYGEGKDPEAYVPLPDGRTIPVSITAPSIAPAATVNNAPTIVNAPQISINVEGGSRGPEADQELAQKIGQHVEASLQHTITREIHRQMRPGGIIAAGRR